MTINDRISEGVDVCVYMDKRRKWIVKVSPGKVFGSDRGIVKMDDFIGREWGSEIELSTGGRAYLFRPLLIDYLEKGFKRRTQVLYPKDIGLIVLLLDISPGKKVLEAGLGSGFMTSVIANLVRPDGKVVAYEIRQDFVEVALANLRRIGLDKYVEIRLKDIKLGVPEKRFFDAAILDLPDPWDVLDIVYNALKPSSPVVFFLPTISQVDKLLTKIIEHGKFKDIRCYETILREYRVMPGALRPETRMTGHTGYIVFSRTIL